MDELQSRHPKQPINMGMYLTEGEAWAANRFGQPAQYVQGDEPIPEGQFYRHATVPRGFQDMWHVSPRENRESILEHGLQGHKPEHHDESPWQYTWPQPAGNYMFNDIDDARAYV